MKVAMGERGTRSRRLGWDGWAVAGVGVLAAVSALGACADALSIQPPTETTPGAGGTPGTGGSGGLAEGGAAPVPCVSNSDCPAPTAVCDTVRGVCVECLELADCGSMPGTVCSEGACICPVAGDSWCAPALCVDHATDPQHCGQCNKPCFGPCDMGQCVDRWEPVVSPGAPEARARHVAAWTGAVMVVWGGTVNTGAAANLATGAMYDPVALEWTPTSAVGAPSPRQLAASVWTGSHLIVWGGRDGAVFHNDGALFDPATNTWAPMSTQGAPSGRIEHAAVWTGSKLIVWGGLDATGEQLDTGAVYDPAANSWTAMAPPPAPVATRERHSAVWAGTEMWVYGGFGDAPSLVLTNTYWPTGGVAGGLRYEPNANVWSQLPATGQPSARDRHTAVFDGTHMIVFGGFNGTEDNNLGHRVNAGAIQWEGLGGTAPLARREHTAVWLDGPGLMVVWGGRSTLSGVLGTGAVYSSSGNLWTEPTPTVLAPRTEHTAISTGDAMIVWGGFDAANAPLGDGGIFTP